MLYLPKLSDSIYKLAWLSERTYNALIRLWIRHIKDFYPYKKDIRVLLNEKWIWTNAISEINAALCNFEWYHSYSLDDLFERCNNEDEFEEMELDGVDIEVTSQRQQKAPISPFFKYNNLTYYVNSPSFIVFEDKRLRRNFIKNKLTFKDILTIDNFLIIKWIWRKWLEDITKTKQAMIDYIRSFNWDVVDPIFLEVDKIDIHQIVVNYYDNLPDIEKSIINLRFRRFIWWDDHKVTGREIWEKYDLTTERVRQYEEDILKEFKFFIEAHDDLLNNYFIDVLIIKWDLSYHKYDTLSILNKFSYDFLCDIFSIVLKWSYIFYHNDYTQTFFFIKRDWVIDWQYIATLFASLDKKYASKRITDKEIHLKNFVGSTIWDFWDDAREYMQPILKTYLSVCYKINVDKWSFELLANKRNYELTVMHELAKLDEPIHFTEMYKLMCEKYPQFKRKEQGIFKILLEDENSINVGKWLYIHVKKRPYLKWLKTTEDVIIKYLSEQPNKKAKLSEILFFVRQYKDVDNWTIESVLNLNKNWKFVKINNKEFWLREYR